MDSQGRSTVPLRYRFAALSQARSHLRTVSGRTLFFFRDRELKLAPWSPVSLEWSFQSGEPNRLVHGWVLSRVEGAGIWIELLDTRPLRELSPAGHTRRFRRLGTDHTLQLNLGGQRQLCRMLDLSEGGARLGGVSGLSVRDHVELRLLSPDRLTFHELGGAFVSWADHDELGIQFDRLDSLSRAAVARLVSDTEQIWNAAWQAHHPAPCCGVLGVIDPEPPRLIPPERPSLRVAG